MSAPVIGSDGWENCSKIFGSRRDHILNFNESFDWNKVTIICSSLRGGRRCELSENFQVGSWKIVKRVSFADGVNWAICITLPEEDGEESGIDIVSAKLQLESLVATYEYLGQHTTLPVPKVIAADYHNKSVLGVPYIILTYIHGTPVSAFPLHKDLLTPGNVVQHEYLLKQMAYTTVELARHKFDSIGSLFRNKKTGEFYIDFNVETSKHCSTALEHYSGISSHLYKKYGPTLVQESRNPLDVGVELPFIFHFLMPNFLDPRDDVGPFSLANLDFGFHNILIDESFKIVGVIGCASIIAAPIHVVAQYPSLSGIQCRRPGSKTNNTLLMGTYERDEASAKLFRGFVRAAEHAMGGSPTRATPIADTMDSDGARLFEGLQAYQGIQDWVNRNWLKSYTFMYDRMIKGADNVEEYEQEVPEAADTHDNYDEQLNRAVEGAEEEKAKECAETESKGGLNSENTMRQIVESIEQLSMASENERSSEAETEVLEDGEMGSGHCPTIGKQQSTEGLQDDLTDSDDEIEIITCDSHRANELKDKLGLVEPDSIVWSNVSPVKMMAFATNVASPEKFVSHNNADCHSEGSTQSPRQVSRLPVIEEEGETEIDEEALSYYSEKLNHFLEVEKTARAAIEDHLSYLEARMLKLEGANAQTEQTIEVSQANPEVLAVQQTEDDDRYFL